MDAVRSTTTKTAPLSAVSRRSQSCTAARSANRCTMMKTPRSNAAARRGLFAAHHAHVITRKHPSITGRLSSQVTATPAIHFSRFASKSASKTTTLSALHTAKKAFCADLISSNHAAPRQGSPHEHRNHLPQQRTACGCLLVFAVHPGEAMSRLKKLPGHLYWREELEGAHAGIDACCPYGIDQIGKRCAWLAGYRDAHRRNVG